MLSDKQLLIAALRYRLIIDALDVPKGERAGVLRAIAAKEHTTACGKGLKVSLRTLERWVSRYEKLGLSGLVRPKRKDLGQTRSVLPTALERSVALRKELSSRSTPILIDILERSGEVGKGAIKRSTLDRHLDKRGASRRMLHVLGTKRHVRLSFEHPMDFVVGDFHHGPYVRGEGDEIVRAKLEAFIDHVSRYVPESRYGLTEDTMALRRGTRALFTLHGLPKKFYVDNGSAYQANRFHFGCEQLGVKIAHSKPYVSEGRGVIERFNRTVKEAFEQEVLSRLETPTLKELNDWWRAWLEERYHRIVHSETMEPPLDRWQRLLLKAEIRQADPVLLDEVFRLQAKRTVHSKTSTVEVAAQHFVVDTSLRKRRVDVLYDPHDLSSVLIYYEGKRIHRAHPQVLGERPVSAPAPAVKQAPTVDYLGLLKRDHDKRRQEDLSQIRFQSVRNDAAHLNMPLLLERIGRCTGRTLGAVERAEVTRTLERLSPLEIAIADVALKIAVSSLGHGLHASQYLTALENHVLIARTKGSL